EISPGRSIKADFPASHRRRSGRSMPQKVRIALDAMGGDHGPSVVVPGAAVALAQYPDASFILFGDQAKIEPLLAAHPTLKGSCIVLDLGASIGADAESLVAMAVMGTAMSRVLFHLDRPTVGLLNIGVEEAKGLEAVREAGRILREEPLPHLDYIGFVE